MTWRRRRRQEVKFQQVGGRLLLVVNVRHNCQYQKYEYEEEEAEQNSRLKY